jgi:RES domain-containing protein
LKHGLETLRIALESAPGIGVKAELSRLVPFVDLASNDPTNWLFASGKPNRYNPAGVECVYFGETREVAQAEYDSMWKGVPASHQPVTTFFADVSLKRVLDLMDAATLRVMKVDAKELFKKWRRARYPTLTQLLGQAVNDIHDFSAIRYPSAALAGHANLVIFRDCVRMPDSVRILGPTRKPLQKWP